MVMKLKHFRSFLLLFLAINLMFIEFMPIEFAFPRISDGETNDLIYIRDQSFETLNIGNNDEILKIYINCEIDTLSLENVGFLSFENCSINFIEGTSVHHISIINTSIQNSIIFLNSGHLVLSSCEILAEELHFTSCSDVQISDSNISTHIEIIDSESINIIDSSVLSEIGFSFCDISKITIQNCTLVNEISFSFQSIIEDLFFRNNHVNSSKIINATSYSLVGNCDFSNNIFHAPLFGEFTNQIPNPNQEIKISNNYFSNITFGIDSEEEIDVSVENNYYFDYEEKYPAAFIVGKTWSHPYNLSSDMGWVDDAALVSNSEIMSQVHCFWDLYENIDPVLSHIGDININLNSDTIIDVEITDNDIFFSCAYILVEINNEIIIQRPFYFERNISIFTQNLPEGSHEIVVTFTDGLGGVGFDQSMIFINDAPSIIREGNQERTIQLEDTLIVNWEIVDSSIKSNAEYSIYLNNTLIETLTFVDTDIAYSYIFDAAGEYDLTIIFRDGFGGIASDTVSIIVNAIPTLTQHDDLSVYINHNVLLNWTLNDTTSLNPYYELYIDGEKIFEENFDFPYFLQYNYSNVAFGYHQINLIVHDGYGQKTSDVFVVFAVSEAPDEIPDETPDENIGPNVWVFVGIGGAVVIAIVVGIVVIKRKKWQRVI